MPRVVRVTLVEPGAAPPSLLIAGSSDEMSADSFPREGQPGCKRTGCKRTQPELLNRRVRSLRCVARAGVEPATFHFSGERCYQLSYLAKIAVTSPGGNVTAFATPTGLEPATSAVTGRRANQLRYGALTALGALPGARETIAQEPDRRKCVRRSAEKPVADEVPTPAGVDRRGPRRAHRPRPRPPGQAQYCAW